MEARQLLSLMGRTKDTPCLKQEKTYERVFIPVFPSLSLHFFFFFLILAEEFTHQVLANSGNKELVKRDSGGYSKRAAGAPPPHPCHFGFHPGEAWAGLQEAREKRRVQRLPPRGSVP